MKHNRLTMLLTLLSLLLLLIVAAVVLAQTSTEFHLEWNVIGSGGGESSSASFQVNSTIGQGVGSQPVSNSFSYAASSGYWWFTDNERRIYLPLVIKE